MKLGRLRMALQKMLESFSQVSTDKGILSWGSEGELPEIGEEVKVVDEEGNETVPEDGEYALEDGKILVIKDGKVEEIKEKEEEVIEEVKEEITEEPVEEELEEVAVIEPVEPEPVDESGNVEETINLEEKLVALETLVAELIGRVAALEGKPAAAPAQEEFVRVNSTKRTGNEKMDRMNEILNAKR